MTHRSPSRVPDEPGASGTLRSLGSRVPDEPGASGTLRSLEPL